MEQRSEEWFAARLGKVTASRIGDLMARNSGGYAASRANYMAELLVERLTGEPREGFQSAAMAWGTETEPMARSAYAFHCDAQVSEVGFVDHPTVTQSGASPDGLVGDQGMVEIKCPNTATHIDTLLGAKIARKYLLQMQWQMACAKRAWCDFVSFDPRLPEEMRLHVERVERDDALIGQIEAEVQTFLEELARKHGQLIGRYGAPDWRAA